MRIIEINNLSKIYPNGKKALDNISLSFDSGDVFGFLGPNGAGKTTTVKLLNGMLSPTEGSINVLGIDPSKSPEKLHQYAGVVTEHAQMYDILTGMQNLIFYGSLFGMNKNDAKKRADTLLKRLELSEAKDKKLGTYSTGMRQRLSFARALMHSPKILFLDEPTSGLDPESAQNVNQMIQCLAVDDGVTVFLCTHQLRYAQEICTKYGLIDEGKLLADGTLQNLRSLISSKTRLRIKADKIADNMSFKYTQGGFWEKDIKSENEIPDIVRQIVESGGNILSVSAEQPTLEDIYFELTANRKEEFK